MGAAESERADSRHHPESGALMAIGASLRGTLSKYVPSWLGNVPGLRNLYSVLWTVALAGDGLREIAWEGQLAAYPGVGTPTALPYIGASRGLVQGPGESNAAFAIRCQNWKAEVALMGSSRGLVAQIQDYLCGAGSLGAGVYPVVAFIDRAGHVVTAHADQSITETTTTWSWDTLGGWTDAFRYHSPAEVSAWWVDAIILIQDPFTHYTSETDPNWLAAWNSGDQTIDSIVPQSTVFAIQAILDRWKGQHVYARCIAWVPDPTTFVPTGWYGNWSSNQAGEQKARRNPAYAYWQPLFGG